MASSLETLRSVERQLITRVGQNVAADEARRSVAQAWREIINIHEWSWVRRATELAVQTVAPKQDGTISIPRGSRTVTGVGTGFDDGDVRSKIILEDSAYLVEAVPSATELTLFKPYVGADITAKTYLLFKDLYPLDDDVYEVLSMTGRSMFWSRPRLTRCSSSPPRSRSASTSAIRRTSTTRIFWRTGRRKLACTRRPTRPTTCRMRASNGRP